ncbi:MAG: molybdopterin-binding protein, partial [Nitrososphaerales archaeon]|nr:molybdopterin-binding protein [Nitrososphaerales archaeon]
MILILSVIMVSIRSTLKRVCFEIIPIGNELLLGEVLDTNSQWMAKKITELGGFVTRITIVGDDVEIISSTIQEALKRRPSWIITCGGLGPTYDDKTLAGIAKATGRELIVNRDAVKMLEERYRILVEKGVVKDGRLTPTRLKMATLPEGAIPIQNRVGTAPAVLLKVNDVKIVSLPGVPSEMKDIFEHSLIPLFKEDIGRIYHSEMFLEVIDIVESKIAPILDKVLEGKSNIYVKSHPKMVEEGRSRLVIHIVGWAYTQEEVEEIVKNTSKELIEMIEGQGGKVVGSYTK